MTYLNKCCIFCIFDIIFFWSSSAKRASLAQSKRVDDEEEHPAATATPDSARKRRSWWLHGLQHEDFWTIIVWTRRSGLDPHLHMRA